MIHIAASSSRPDDTHKNGPRVPPPTFVREFLKNTCADLVCVRGSLSQLFRTFFPWKHVLTFGEINRSAAIFLGFSRVKRAPRNTRLVSFKRNSFWYGFKTKEHVHSLMCFRGANCISTEPGQLFPPPRFQSLCWAELQPMIIFIVVLRSMVG